MAINFPDNPSDGDIATIGGVTYTYTANANSWKPPAPGASASTLTDLNISDGTSGQLLTTDGNNNFSFTSISSASSTEIFADMAALIAKTGMSAGDQGLVMDNNRLFMYTGSAWYLIATMVNNSPTAITNVDSSYDLSLDGTPTVITATSTDPEGFPLTWSYAITSGSLGSTATISQADNVFTITPSTDSADSGNFTLTISATDGGSSGIVNKVISISLLFVVTNSRYTTLLVTATEDSDNNNITDSSTNNHSITLNGNPYAGTFSPYRSGGYSTYFATSGSTSTSSGTGQTIQSDLTSELTLDTNDFTISFWVYGISKLRNYPRILQIGPQNTPWGASQLAILYKHNDDNDSITLAMHGIGGNSLLIASGPINDNQWYHVAVTRSGSTFTLYINGVSAGTYTSTGSATGTGNKSIQIGGNTAGDSDFHGYIADVNVINGTAIYTSNFAPPTDPLAADTNTKFSFGNLPYFKDQSTSDHSLTVSSGILIKPFSPYDYPGYTATSNGGSVYFPGGGAASFTPSDASFGFGTGDYTIEGWFNFDDNGAFTGGDGSTILSTLNSLSGVGAHLWVASNVIRFYNASADRIVSSAVSVKEWHHIALVRSSGNTKLYIDGNQTGSTYADSNDYGTTAPFSIGSYHVNGAVGSVTKNMIGYVSDLKVTKGQAIYTSSFTPPTAPLSSSGAGLHIKGTDASIIDKSQTSNINLIGNASGSTTQVKFSNSKSIYFDGNGDYITAAASSSILGDGDFTVETWIYANSIDSAYRCICSQGSGGTSFRMFLNGTTIQVWRGASQMINYENSTVGNTWYHIAYSDDTLYVNGQSVTTIPTPGFDHTLTSIDIGGNDNGSINGYMADFRITKGLARYTANFTPRTSSLNG